MKLTLGQPLLGLLEDEQGRYSISNRNCASSDVIALTVVLR